MEMPVVRAIFTQESLQNFPKKTCSRTVLEQEQGGRLSVMKKTLPDMPNTTYVGHCRVGPDDPTLEWPTIFLMVLAGILGGIQVQTVNASAPQFETVILADVSDPYYDVAREIAQHEDLSIVHSWDDAFRAEPDFVIWVAAPDSFSESLFAQFGQALMARETLLSVGIITGNSPDAVRALWQRRLRSGPRVAVIPREEQIARSDHELVTVQPLNTVTMMTALQTASYLTFQGHGSRKMWALHDRNELFANDIPALPPLLVNALACQTLKIWSDESIALQFLQQGAAAYAGFVHSPMAYAFGEPSEFPCAYTWPEFPIGHVVHIQNRGYLKGFLSWPFYVLLGDPRLSFLRDRPYVLMDDVRQGSRRMLTYHVAPEGVMPVRIPDGARYEFVEIPGVGAAWTYDPFFDVTMQMTDIGPDKYLLFRHRGGEFTITLTPRPPWHRRMITPFIHALDHTTVLYHAEGSVAATLGTGGILVMIFGWRLWRHRQRSRRYWLGALICGLIFTLFRGGYALLRHAALVELYTQRLRTMDVAFEINILILLATWAVATCGAWLALTIRTRWGKGLVLLTITSPGWFIALFSLGMHSITNMLATQQYGITLYGYGQESMALMACLVEGVIVGFSVWGLQRYYTSWHVQDDRRISFNRM